MRLTENQRRAVETIDQNLQIIACAGSGKTEVLARRIAHILKMKPEVRPEQIVAFTFTEKAAEELKARIMRVTEAEGVQRSDMADMFVGTIHAFCHQLLNRFCSQYGDMRILDTVKNHLFVERHHCGIERLGLCTGAYDIPVYLDCIDKLVDDYENRAQWTESQRDALDEYRRCLCEHQFLDFTLLIHEALNQIQTNARVQTYLSSVQYLFVDEYQDINAMQAHLVDDFFRYGANLCVVGDDDQTIYQFRGSSAEYMIDFVQKYPDVIQVRLEDNFRCATGIVDAAERLIAHNQRRLPKAMVSRASGTAAIEARGFDNIYDENMYIADAVGRAHQAGVPYGEIAILVRKGKFAASVCAKLEERGIPCVANTAEDFFKGPYFARFIDTLKNLQNVSKVGLWECWQGVVPQENITPAFRFLRRAGRSGDSMSMGRIVREFAEQLDFLNPDAPDIETRRDDLLGIVTILDDYDEIYGDYQLSARVSRLIRFLESQAAWEYRYHRFRAEEGTDAVQIMTMHRAKGLEFDTVILPELEEGEFPLLGTWGRQYWHVLGGRFKEERGRYTGDIEDERKLFYVAITRAKRQLMLLWQTSKHGASPFVREALESIDISH